MTASDILGYCLADDNPNRFLNIDLQELQPHLDHIDDQDLVECLKSGIGYYHEAMTKQDKRIVSSLLQAEAIKVLVVSKVNNIARSFLSALLS